MTVNSKTDKALSQLESTINEFGGKLHGDWYSVTVQKRYADIEFPTVNHASDWYRLMKLFAPDLQCIFRDYVYDFETIVIVTVSLGRDDE